MFSCSIKPVKFANVLINFLYYIRGEKLRVHSSIMETSSVYSRDGKTRLAYKIGDLSLARFSNELHDLVLR